MSLLAGKLIRIKLNDEEVVGKSKSHHVIATCFDVTRVKLSERSVILLADISSSQAENESVARSVRAVRTVPHDRQDVPEAKPGGAGGCGCGATS